VGAAIAFYVVGAILMLIAVVMDPSVPTNVNGVMGLPDNVVNMQKLQIQNMIWTAGLAAVVVGAVFQPKRWSSGGHNRTSVPNEAGVTDKPQPAPPTGKFGPFEYIMLAVGIVFLIIFVRIVFSL